MVFSAWFLSCALSSSYIWYISRWPWSRAICWYMLFVLKTDLARYGRVRVFRVLELSTRVFSLPFGWLVLCLVLSDSPGLGLSNDSRMRFVALGLKGRQGVESTRFGLLRPGWRGRIWSSLEAEGIIGMGSRSSFEWRYFQEDRSSFEFWFLIFWWFIVIIVICDTSFDIHSL
jgi:hypothetical protein